MSHAEAAKRCKTTNWAQYNASLKASGSLTIWPDKGIAWLVAGSGQAFMRLCSRVFNRLRDFNAALWLAQLVVR